MSGTEKEKILVKDMATSAVISIHPGAKLSEVISLSGICRWKKL